MTPNIRHELAVGRMRSMPETVRWMKWLGDIRERLEHEVGTSGPAKEAEHAYGEWASETFKCKAKNSCQDAEHENDRRYPPRNVPAVVGEIDEPRDRTGKG